MESNKITGSFGSLPLPGSTAFVPATKTSTPDAQPPLPEQVQQADRTQKAKNDFERLQTVKQVAASFAYPLGDERVTIYMKDGVYYAQYTSLRDGSRRTFPEPDLMFRAGIGPGNSGSVVDTTA